MFNGGMKISHGPWPTKGRARLFPEIFSHMRRSTSVWVGSWSNIDLWRIVFSIEGHSVTTGMFLVRPAARGVTDVLAILLVPISRLLKHV
jgi:hypothetical protein